MALKQDINELKIIRRKIDSLLKKINYGFGWEELADADIKLSIAENKMRKN